jgi:pimeloyl-ACP methyl ester carboxylesterase
MRNNMLSTIFLPGLLCDETVWPAQIAAFAGRSECRVADYGALDSLPGMAASVLEDAPDEFLLVAHSMGGRVALEMFRLAEDRIKGLALLDTGYQARVPGEAGERESATRMALIELARESGMRTMGERWARGMVHPDRLADAALMTAIHDMIERKSLDVFEAQVRALLARPEAGPLLPRIRCPTLLLCGREDAWSPPARHEEMARAIPGARLVLVNDCGHMSTMERPEAVNAALLSWLDESVARQPRQGQDHP